MLQNVIAVVPVLNPEESLISYVAQLQETGIGCVVCVDDGSCLGKEVFAKLEHCGVRILRHAVNLGKGRALKTAFNYILNTFEGEYCIVTVDADGQHSIESVKKCIDCYRDLKNKKVLVFGSRLFVSTDQCKIPLRSRIGNLVTKKVFSFLCGIRLQDTQTGLRAFGLNLLPVLLQIKGERYEYETNMILQAKRLTEGLEFVEIEIETIYEDNNAASHFNPIRDSFEIYKLIAAYSIASLLSVVIDYSIFSFAMFIGLGILCSTYLGRFLAAIVNFAVNRELVFKTKGRRSRQLVRYIMLLCVSGLLSATGVYLLKNLLHWNVILCKMGVETVLFFLNYYVQDKYVFGEK